MAAFDNQQAWFPDDNSRDCSHGFCTIYCPQWCYALFPPPPPFPLTGNFNHRAAAFSPPVITIIGILATFFLLTTYYKLVSKFCAFFYSRRSPPHHRSNPNDSVDDEEETDSADSYHQESWHLPPSNGLDEAFIRKITTFRYKRGEGLVEGTECSVCLSEFIEDENLRLLPKCSHAFHLQCIDTWLKSHSNCPLCRVNILLPTLASEEDEQDAVVIAVRDLDLVKDFEAIEMAEDRRRLLPAGSSRRGRGERGKVRSGRSRGLLSVMSPVRMKRSVWSGRNGFARQGRRRRALLLPVCVMAA